MWWEIVQQHLAGRSCSLSCKYSHTHEDSLLPKYVLYNVLSIKGDLILSHGGDSFHCSGMSSIGIACVDISIRLDDEPVNVAILERDNMVSARDSSSHHNSSAIEDSWSYA